MMQRINSHPTHHPPLTTRRLFLAAVCALLGAAVVLTRDGVDVFGPLRFLVRRAMIGSLGTMLAGYLAILPAAVLGTVLSGWMVWRAGRPGAKTARSRRVRPSRARALRWLLLCGSTLVGLGLAETASALWLAWIHRLPTLSDRWAAAARPGDEVSIVVIGGSSALGVPYEGWISVGTIVGRELSRTIPNRRFHVEILAKRGATLEEQHQKLARLPHGPDVLIVYSGHNEFVTRFSWLHRAAYYHDESFTSRHWDALQRLADLSPLFRLVRENLEKQRVGLIPSRMFGPRETLVGRPVCTPEETAAIEADFRRRLESIVADCERIGCLPILIIPPSCDAWDPNQSYGADSMRQDQREVLFRRLTATRVREADDPAGALAAYRDIVADQPTLAEAHYRLARRLESVGSFAEARDHYILARDRDGLPMRCTTPLEDAYRAVARRWPDVVQVDGPAVLRARSRHGILDDHLFHDNVHPTLAGHVALAEAVLGQLKARGALDWPESASAPALDAGRCAAELGLDVRAWATVCDRTVDQLNLIALVPYDPADRLRLRDRYAIAADRIRAGTWPEDAGIPGLGTNSP
jgi:hypothetical protein